MMRAHNRTHRCLLGVLFISLMAVAIKQVIAEPPADPVAAGGPSPAVSNQPKDDQQGGANEEPSMRKKTHLIEVGDRLNIKIYPEDEYIKGGEMEVSSEGTITLPLIGKVAVEGKKISYAEAEIVDLLAKDYLVSPVVVIEVSERIAEKEKKSVSILGQVQKPGAYEIPPDEKMTLLRLISIAGGFSDVANVKKIKVIRKRSGTTKVISANAQSIIAGKDPDIELEPNDVVHVGESFF